MYFNPFEEKARSIESTFTDLKGLSPYSYDKNDVDPYTRLRVILMNGTEFENVTYSHNFSRSADNNDLRRDLALIRRGEQQQQKRISALKPKNETILETTIGYEHLAVDLTALLAQREPDPYVKKALDFALLEDFDHLYRYANLLENDTGVKADKMIGSLAEITPGRPTVSEHRHPFDDIRRRICSKTAQPQTKLCVNIITAAEQQTMNYYMNIGQFYKNEIGRDLYSEIAMIEEQHVSHYGSLLDSTCTPLEKLLMHQYVECYLYWSCAVSETDPIIKGIWEMHLSAEIAHLHKAVQMLKAYENKEWESVIPKDQAAFPEPLIFVPTKDYVRNVLQTTVFETSDKEDYAYINDVPDQSDFFKYQNTIISSVDQVPSHKVIADYISSHGKDYRATDKETPVEELADRKKDNTTVGRIKSQTTLKKTA